jgi:hypothetical protein
MHACNMQLGRRATPDLAEDKLHISNENIAQPLKFARPTHPRLVVITEVLSTFYF